MRALRVRPAREAPGARLQAQQPIWLDRAYSSQPSWLPPSQARPNHSFAWRKSCGAPSPKAYIVQG